MTGTTSKGEKSKRVWLEERWPGGSVSQEKKDVKSMGEDTKEREISSNI